MCVTGLIMGHWAWFGSRRSEFVLLGFSSVYSSIIVVRTSIPYLISSLWGCNSCRLVCFTPLLERCLLMCFLSYWELLGSLGGKWVTGLKMGHWAWFGSLRSEFVVLDFSSVNSSILWVWSICSLAAIVSHVRVPFLGFFSRILSIGTLCQLGLSYGSCWSSICSLLWIW